MDGGLKAFKLRLIALAMAILLGIMVVIYFAVYVSAKDTIEKQLRLNAQTLAVAAACIVEQDIDGYKAFSESKDTNSDYYLQMHEIFMTIKANSNIRYLYTERKIDEKSFEYILDAEIIGHHDHSLPGTIEEIDLQREFVYATEQPTVFNLANHPIWGSLVSAYAPIVDKNGEILGTAGVDIDSSELYNNLVRVQIMLLVTYFGIAVVTLLILLKSANTVFEPLFKDKLTGAYVKRYSEKLIQEEISDAVRRRKDLSLMMLDLDHFKNINDTHGHIFGDVVLSAVSNAIKKTLREKDYFIRYGGEEFIVLIPQASNKQAIEIAERIRKSVSDTEILNEEKNLIIKITISIGIAYLNDSAVSVQEFIACADRALYAAKVTRNCVRTFEGYPGTVTT